MAEDSCPDAIDKKDGQIKEDSVICRQSPLIAHDGKFANMDVRFDRLEKVITGVVSAHETRIKKLEEKVVLSK